MSPDPMHDVDQRPYDEDEMTEILAAWLAPPREPVDEVVAGAHA